MNKEIETLINNLEGCVGMFDYMLTPIENDLLLSYINELQQENQQLHNKIDKAIEYIEKFSDPSIGAIKRMLKESDVDE